MDRKAFIIAVVIGIAAQLAMIAAGHFVPVIKDKGFMVGGLLISLIAGLLYARLSAAPRWPTALLDGGLAGGVCALIGIGASVALGDTEPVILVVGTLSSIVTGIVGGAIGKLLH